MSLDEPAKGDTRDARLEIDEHFLKGTILDAASRLLSAERRGEVSIQISLGDLDGCRAFDRGLTEEIRDVSDRRG